MGFSLLSNPKFQSREKAGWIPLAAMVALGCWSDSPTGPSDNRPGFASASDPVTLIGAGDIAGCASNHKDEAVAALIKTMPEARVFAAGDDAYPDGTAADYLCYHASWGAFKDRTYPSPGNHDYHVVNAAGDTVQAPGAPGYFNYFNGVGVDSGRAGRRGQGYYAYDYGAWRIYALNTEEGTASRNAQLAWLKADLANNPRQCTLAYFHRPLFTSRTGPVNFDPRARAIWDVFYAGGGDVIVAGHQHQYERFAQQRPDGTRDDAKGVREFVIGTGGAPLYSFGTPLANSQVRISAHGILKLTLRPGEYSWAFVPILAGTATDAGTTTCAGAAPSPPPPIALTVSGREDATKQYMTLDWTGARGTTVDVYRDGAFHMNTANDGHYTNSRTSQGSITYTYKVCETGSAVCSNAASVTFGAGSPPANAPPTSNFTSSCSGLACSFTDTSVDGDGTVTGWSWNFGDGGTSAVKNPSHTYASGNTYTVTLVARDDDGAAGNTATKSVTVAPPAPNAPPVSDFTSSCTGRTCTFSDASTDGDGTVTGWSWDFGDGGTSALKNPSHTYESDGTFTVTLVAKDDDGASGNTASKQVTTTPPPPNSAPVSDFTSSCTGLTCTFSDASSDSDGTVTGWSWDFGDGGTSNLKNPTHTYATEGPYTVTLVATDDDGATGNTASKSVTVTPPPPNAPPTSNFTSSCSGLSCSFTDASTDSDGTVTSWSWNFGDGGTSALKNPTHAYGIQGTYTVTLVATDNAGTGGAAVSKSVTVTAPSNQPPIVNFSWSCSNLSCTFTDASKDPDGTMRSWSWTFGDGSTSTVRHPSHTYALAGTYSVKVTVTDNLGATNQKSASVTVTQPATSTIVLTLTGRQDATTQYMTLDWTGARGSTVDVYRNGAFHTNTLNDGHYVNSRAFTGAITYTYKVCETGTTICSSNKSVTFP